MDDHASSNTHASTYSLGANNQWTVTQLSGTVAGHVNDTYTYSEFYDQVDPSGDDSGYNVTFNEKSNYTYGGAINSGSTPGSISGTGTASGTVSATGYGSMAVPDPLGYVTFPTLSSQTQQFISDTTFVQNGNNGPAITGDENVTVNTSAMPSGGGVTNDPAVSYTLGSPGNFPGWDYPGGVLDIADFSVYDTGFSPLAGSPNQAAGSLNQVGSTPTLPGSPSWLTSAWHGVVNLFDGNDTQAIINALVKADYAIGDFLYNNPYARYIPLVGSFTSLYKDISAGNYKAAALDGVFFLADASMVGGVVTNLGKLAVESATKLAGEDLVKAGAQDVSENLVGGLTEDASRGESAAVECANPPDGCFVAGTLVARPTCKQAIEAIGSGRRLIRGNTASAPTAIVPADSRQLHLRYVKPQTGQTIYLSLIRPTINVGHLKRGQQVTLKVVELELDGHAEVLGVEPCPPIEEGDGPVVTGTIRSNHSDLRQLKLEGLDDPIEVTANHPIFSEDRNAFVPTSELTPGERLRTRTGTATVEYIKRLPGTWTVYNLEVEHVHQYHVSEKEVLVHNVGANGLCGFSVDDGGYAQAKIDEAADPYGDSEDLSNIDSDGSPDEPYDRNAQYPNSPTQADRNAFGAGSDQVVNHEPPLIQRYYEGDPSIGEEPGFQMTQEERDASAADRSRMNLQSIDESRQQGGQMANYSKTMKELYGF